MEQQIAEHREGMRKCGQGSSKMRLLPNRRNLLKIDWPKL
jgi:hypothetical protein